MVIYGPKHIPYDIDLGPVLLSDWFHKDYFTVVEAIVGNNASNWPQASNNNLINGRNNFNCSSVTNGTPCFNNAGLSKFRFRAGKVHKLRLVNAGAAGLQKFSIDGHMLTVIANDYVAIKPYNTSVVTLGIGQRSDVLVTATGNRNGSYYMRSSQPTIPCARAEYPNALAVILYDNATKDSIPTSSPQPAGAPDPTCSNDDLSLTTPFYPMTPDPNPAVTQTIVVNQGVNASGHQVYTMDGSTFHANYNHPLLLLANEKNTSYPSDPQWNVYNFGNNGSVRIVVYNNNSSPHPMHLHGHDMYILSAGEGPWDGTTIINPQNPQRRDVQNLSPHGHLVMQFEADNPGVWPFHCHIAWHLSMGFYVNFLERPDDITQMQIPMVMAQTCTDWEAYSSKNVVLQIDDGV
ncbi:hypothetical protein MMC24_006356 [Lignoscripta atroalba]|nr:hypothetical protein [Lignoscripta atroalba]